MKTDVIIVIIIAIVCTALLYFDYQQESARMSVQTVHEHK